MELARRDRLCRDNRPPLTVTGKNIVLVDDGIATGATINAALAVLKKLHAKSVIIAVPTAPAESLMELNELADRVICLYWPVDFRAVGEAYQDFTQTTDEAVTHLLQQARQQLTE